MALRALLRELERLGIDAGQGPASAEQWQALLAGLAALEPSGAALERQKAADELARLAHVARSMGDFVVITDLEGRIDFVNQAVLDRFGYCQEELLGQKARIFLSSRNPPGLAGQVFQLTSSGAGFSGDVINVTRSGEEFWVSMTTSLLREGSRVLGMLAISRDVSDRKKAEAELKKAKEEAERANRAKSEFLANMSHEIRTPMNAVIGMTGLLLDTDLSAEQRDFVETIRTSGDALLSIINDILDFSKMESGKLDLEQQPFEVRDLVEESLDLIVPRSADKNLNLAYYIEPDVPAAVVGDAARVRQILVNYLSNAIKFTQRGEIEVRVAADHDSGPRPEIRFSVRDSGIGIPQHRRDRLFQSFSQVDASMTRQFGGTGLGLAICKRLSDMMGGRVWVESEFGKGSTFSFAFRPLPARPAEEPVPGESRFALADFRLLVVDEFPSNRRIIEAYASSWGVAVKSTSSALEALAWLKAGEEFDAAIVSREHTEMDAAALAEEVQARTEREMPLVLLTPARKREEVPGGRFAATLTKPVKPLSLMNTLIRLSEKAQIRASRRAQEPPIDRHLGSRHPLRILIAEDNAVNQRVAQQMLSRLGYRADVAANGVEVLEALKRQPYDVVLLDVQMPEMDGIETARRIRAESGAGKGPRLIAMTASAMKGDREECLASGMDDYVSKPVQIQFLQRALMAAKKRDLDPSLHRQVTSGIAVDMSALAGLRQYQEDGQPDIVTQLIDDFLKEAPRKLATMEGAAARGEFEVLRRTAHSLKTAAASIGARRLSALCAWIETVPTLENLRETHPRLLQEFEKVRQLLGRERIEEAPPASS
ncbi:MAG: response regulator [Thermoanaerobaculia bacterium]|nr:response regulator [Thermoanaerobaculia bacterium]